MFGIDVSTYQGMIDWNVTREHIDFAILRCGYGNDILTQDDDTFIRNATECERLHIPYGVYLYSYAENTAMALSEAEHTLRLLDGFKPTLPVFFDMECSAQARLAPKALGDIAETYCNRINGAGFKVGIYANKYWLNTYLTDARFKNWDTWVAQYYKECTYQGDHVMWQYTSTGRVPGIAGNVDCNELYKDYNTTPTNKEVTLMDALVNVVCIELFGREATEDIVNNCRGMSYRECYDALKNTDEAYSFLAKEIYRACMGRDIDPSGLDNLVSMLQNGASKADIMLAIMQSPEYVEYHR